MQLTRRVRRTHCADCGVELTEETGYRKRISDWHSQCKDCKRRARRRKNTDRESTNRLFADRVLCDSCGQPERHTRAGEVRALNKDHDHTTGEWRGVLCSRCNMAIGLLGDNPFLLRAAAAYLENPPGLILIDDAPPESRQEWRKSDWYLAKYGPWTPDGTHPV